MVQNGDSGAKSSRDDGKQSAEPDDTTSNKASPVPSLKKSSAKKGSPVADVNDAKEPEAAGASQTSTSAAAAAVDADDCESDDCTGGDLTTNEDAASDQSHNDPGKMFIGGLSWQTSAEGLRDYFCKFGDVNECMVMRDPATKRARGFGFITFADPTSVEKVLAEESHLLDGKKIDPKVAFPKRQQPKMVVKTKKVFIGGLSATSTLDDMKHYFQQYGKIEDAMLMFDKTTQRHRGFGFITFDDDDISDKVCEIHFHEINGKMVECKKAQPKEVMLPVQMNKSRAAAARNYYGIAPEQLLAYASYMPNMPRLGPYNNPGVLFPTTLFNGFPQSFGLSGTSSRNTSGSHHGALNGGGGNGAGGSALGGSGAGLINPRNLAAVQLAAQQQAVYEAAMAYASSLGSLGSGGSASGGAVSSGGGGANSSVDGSAGGGAHGPLHLVGQPSHHHQRPPVHPTQVVVTTHHHLQHQTRPHHMHSASSQQSHLSHHQQQSPAGGPMQALHHHQHSIGGGAPLQHIHHPHGQQHPQMQQSQQQRPPLLPAHYPPHKI